MGWSRLSSFDLVFFSFFFFTCRVYLTSSRKKFVRRLGVEENHYGIGCEVQNKRNTFMKSVVILEDKMNLIFCSVAMYTAITVALLAKMHWYG